MTTHSARISALLLAFVSLLPSAGCGPANAPRPPAEPQTGRQVYESGVRFRARGDTFEIGDSARGTWRSFFPKGVNLAIAKPGRFPGELAATAEDYARWLERIAGLNANVVRLYTLHFPAFYQAFGEYNRAHPDRPIYLIQGIWLDELDHGDYATDSTAQLDEELAYVVDAVHGAALVPERRGKAYGQYRHDVSSYVLAWLPGHELDGYLVKATNEAWPATTRYDGRYLSSPEGSAIEAWVARGLDAIVARELDRWGVQRPVAWANWPALDPMRHATEPPDLGQDVVDVDFGRFVPRGGFDAGIFVSYHVYPFNPEFIGYDPAYSSTLGEDGRPDSYLGYLRDLKAHHPGVPLLVAEFGVPSSVGNAHVNETAWNHGGYSEAEQAAITARLVRDVVRSGAAGAIAFELIDEWFKRTWLTSPTTLPADRGALWYDVLSPEESFGLLSYYPTAATVTIDGAVDDWVGRGALLAAQPAAPFAPLGDGKDAPRTVTGLWAAADPAYLSLRVDLGGASASDLDDVVLLVGISTLDGATGDHRLPGVDVLLPDDVGLEALLVVDPRAGSAELLIDEPYDPSPFLNGEALTGGNPVENAAGRYVRSSLVINSPAPYLRAGLSYVPAEKRYQPGILRRGTSTDDTRSHWQLGAGVVEVRLPWHALWITDPSSGSVLANDPATGDLDVRVTRGLELAVVAAARLPDGSLRVVDALPRGGFTAGRFASGLPTFRWEGWDSIEAVERVKPAYHALAAAYAAIE